MSTLTVLGQATVSNRQVSGFVRRCRDALQERRKREKVRAALYALNGRDLHDMGIAHSDIEYLASNPNLDPRGI